MMDDFVPFPHFCFSHSPIFPISMQDMRFPDGLKYTESHILSQEEPETGRRREEEDDEGENSVRRKKREMRRRQKIRRRKKTKVGSEERIFLFTSFSRNLLSHSGPAAVVVRRIL